MHMQDLAYILEVRGGTNEGLAEEGIKGIGDVGRIRKLINHQLFINKSLIF